MPVRYSRAHPYSIRTACTPTGGSNTAKIFIGPFEEVLNKYNAASGGTKGVINFAAAIAGMAAFKLLTDKISLLVTKPIEKAVVNKHTTKVAKKTQEKVMGSVRKAGYKVEDAWFNAKGKIRQKFGSKKTETAEPEVTPVTTTNAGSLESKGGLIA